MDNLETKLIHDIRDRRRTNKERFYNLEQAMEQNKSTVMLAIGIHYDHVAKAALPVISGSQWITRDEAIILLKACIQALDNPIINDHESKSTR